jgi:hypothetical protein
MKTIVMYGDSEKAHDNAFLSGLELGDIVTFTPPPLRWWQRILIRLRLRKPPEPRTFVVSWVESNTIFGVE